MMEPLYCEAGPPVDVADRINASYPNAVMKELHKGVVAAITGADATLLDGLNRVEFKTNMGEDGSGFLMLAWRRAGGYYLDVGASQYIIDGKIKLKSGSGVIKFTNTEVLLEDGTAIPADVVVFATGYGDVRVAIRKALGDNVATTCKPFWGLSASYL